MTIQSILNREHSQAFRRIQEIRRLIDREEDESDRIVELCIDFKVTWVAYARAQEAVVYTLVDELEASVAATRRGEDEHHEIEMLSEALIEGRIGDRDWVAALARLTEILPVHLRREQDVVGRAASAIDDQRSAALSARFRAQRTQWLVGEAAELGAPLPSPIEG